MKILRLLAMLAFLLVGLLIGALNSQPVLIDFLFASVPTNSGVAIIVALLAGAVIGSCLVLASVVVPLYSRLRQINKLVNTNRVSAVPPRMSDGL